MQRGEEGGILFVKKKQRLRAACATRPSDHILSIYTVYTYKMQICRATFLSHIRQEPADLGS